MVNFLNSIRAVTDAKGRFRLAGAAKEPQYWLQVDPGPDAPWVSTALVAEDNKGFQPLHVDIKVARGTIVTGRVHDKATGQGVPSELHIVPLPQNTFVGKPGLEFRALQLPTATDGEGRFRLVAPPGRCVLLARARNRDTVIGNSAINPQKTINPYREAEFTAEERKLVSLHKTPEGHRFFETASGEKREYLANSNACTVLDLSEDASALTRDLVVDRGRTLTIHLRDGDGKPVVGCLAGGLTATEADNPALPEASCTVYALDPGRPRQVAFVQPERHLAGLATVRGDEKEPLTVRLLPTGVVTGRLLDASGQPVRGAWVHLYYDGNRTVTVVDGPLRVQQERDVTDRDGRFRLETIFPNVAFRMVAPRVQKTYLEVDPPVANKKVSPGQTLDLGDLRTKPLN